MSNLFVVLTVIALIALTVSGRLQTRKRDRIKRCVIEKTNSILEKNFEALSEKRIQLTKEKWSEEVRYFVLDHVRPALSEKSSASRMKTLQLWHLQSKEPSKL